MHDSVMHWARQTVAVLELAGASVLEVGSYDVNGSVRSLFGGPYLGVDFRDGPGVDRVVEPGVLPFVDASFAVVVSTEALEHDPRPWRTVAEMARVCRGHLLLTTRGFGFAQHDFPGDYWRFSESAVRVLVEDAGLRVLTLTADPQHPGVFCVARKPA